jgi:hypothetical protein
LVLTDSKGVGETVVERGVDSVADGGDAFGEVDERGDAAAPRPGQPAVQCLFPGGALDGEDVAQPFFEQVAAVQSRIGFGDPGELVALAVGEILRVLSEGVAGVLERTGVAGGVASAAAFAAPGPVPSGVVPRLAAYLVQCFGGPLDDVERVSALHRVRAAFGDDLRDPLGLIG